MNYRNRIFYSLLAGAILLGLLTSGCGAISNPFVTKIKTGQLQGVDITVPMPEKNSSGVELNLKFLAGDLKLAPGEDENLASGKATFNAEEFVPEVETVGSSNSVSHGRLEIKGIPSFPKDLKNEWDLKIANVPLSLKIWAGAYTGRFELGGLSLEKLTIEEQGSDVQGSFSKPNNVVMSTFDYTTGGSQLELKGLANANFEQMNFTSGAGTYTLSFDGNLQRDSNVTIDTGASTVNIIVPQGTNATVTFEGGLSSVLPDGSWVKNGDVYTLSGSGPTLNIVVKMGVGTLNLKTM